MSLDELINDGKNLLTAVGIITTIFFAVKGTQKVSKRVSDWNKKRTDTRSVYSLKPYIDAPAAEEYLPTTISNAMESGNSVMITGRVAEFFGIPTGYSGFFEDQFTKMPFYIDNGKSKNVQEQALIPLIFTSSMDDMNDISLKGFYDSVHKIFMVEKLDAVLDGMRYII
jgi:hypothetical protein